MRQRGWPAGSNPALNFRDDADRFRVEMRRLREGAISAAEFRAFHVPLGVYEQREAGTYMLRADRPADPLL